MSLKEELEKLDKEYPVVEYPPSKIIQNDREFLSVPCEVTTLVQATEIWKQLEATLKVVDGYGLSANQIGIQKKVGVIHYEGKTYKLLNPRIVGVSKDRDTLQEGCLSFPTKVCTTVRYTKIIVEDDNLGRLELSADTDGLLPVIFQHEIDHLDGMTIFDRVRRPAQRTSDIPKRNDPCPCGSGKKYKKCCMQ